MQRPWCGDGGAAQSNASVAIGQFQLHGPSSCRVLQRHTAVSNLASIHHNGVETQSVTATASREKLPMRATTPEQNLHRRSAAEERLPYDCQWLPSSPTTEEPAFSIQLNVQEHVALTILI